MFREAKNKLAIDDNNIVQQAVAVKNDGID